MVKPIRDIDQHLALTALTTWREDNMERSRT